MNEELVVEHLPLARFLGAKFSRIPFDDATQEAAVALIRAEQKFSPDRGVKFSAFASNVIRNHLIDASKLYSPMPMGERQDVNDTCELRVELRDAMAKLMPDVRTALEMRFGDNDATYEQIGAALGCSETYARAIVAAGLTKLKSMME